MRCGGIDRTAGCLYNESGKGDRMKRQKREALLRQIFGAMGGAAPGAFFVDEQGNLIELSDEEAALRPVRELSAEELFTGPGDELLCIDEAPENEEAENEETENQE